VSDEITQAYRFESLAKYPFGERMVIRLADLGFYTIIGILGRTIRWETRGLERLEATEADGRTPIFCLWHNRLFAGTYFLRGRGIVVITSQSRDGEYIARFLKRFGFGTVRGSSTRGGVKALVEMIRLMRSGHAMAFTVDGPKGPAQEAKSGAVLLAKKTGNPMLPFTVECERFWTIGSWDRLQIPKPFTRARFEVGSLIEVEAAANDEEIERKRLELQDELRRLGRGY
jgi:lysophospholipid acyltransferase (LPLAT)-like uncharacterized protein